MERQIIRWSIWERPWWRPKPGPVITAGRLIHFILLLILTELAGGLWGYAGIGWSGLALLGIWAWEAASPMLPWQHPYGSVVALLAGVLGWCAGAIVALVCLGIHG